MVMKFGWLQGIVVRRRHSVASLVVIDKTDISDTAPHRCAVFGCRMH